MHKQTAMQICALHAGMVAYVIAGLYRPAIARSRGWPICSKPARSLASPHGTGSVARSLAFGRSPFAFGRSPFAFGRSLGTLARVVSGPGRDRTGRDRTGQDGTGLSHTATRPHGTSRIGTGLRSVRCET